MLKKILILSWLLPAALLALVPAMNAQSAATGGISGYVMDNGKAALPGVVITATSPTMVGSRHALSDANGYYRLPSLPPGKFRITAVLDQFNTLVQNNIEVNIGASLRIDFTMTPASVEKEVVVTAAAPLVEAEKTTMDTVVDTSILNAMPILGRDFMSSIKILPGVTETQFGVSISGGRSESQNFNIDGKDNVDLLNVAVYGGGVTNQLGTTPFMSFDQEAIQELSVGRGAYSAEVGFGSGGVINVITKSGSNNVHGSLYFQMRTSRWDSDPEYPFQTYHFGGSLGGPIVRDKLLYFLSLSPQYGRTGFDTRSSTYEHVPTDLMKPSWGASSFFKLTWLVGKSNTLNISANFALSKAKDYCAAFHAVSDFPEGENRNNGLSLSLSDTAILNANLILESTVAGGRTNDKIVNLSPEENPGMVVDADLYPLPGSATGTAFIDETLASTKFNWSEKLSWFIEDWGGRHAIAAGFEIRGNTTRQWRGYEDQIWLYPPYYQELGMPAVQESITEPYNLKYAQTYAGWYVSDAWTPFKRLTLRPGVRFSRNSYLPKVLVEPRFNFVYDLFGDAKTVIRGGASLYYERINTTAQMLDNMPRIKYVETYADGSVESAVEYKWYETDPGLTYPKTTEFTVGIERALARDIDVSIEFIHRNYRDQFYTRYINLRDRVTKRRDDPTRGVVFYYGNFGHAVYSGLNFVLQKKFSHGNQFMVSYSYQTSKGNSSRFIESSQLQMLFKDKYLFKGDLQLADFSGRTMYDKPYDFKVFGSVTLPFKIILAGVFNYTAGTPFTNYNYRTRQIVDGYQTQRSPSLVNLDLRLEKDVRIGGKTLRIMADAFNATNKENAYEIVGDVSNTINDYGKAMQLGSPRVIQLSARFEW